MDDDKIDITLKGFLIFLAGVWVLFGSIMLMIEICKLVF